MNPNTNISQELLESVEKYFNSNMTSDELKSFEDKLKNDSDFKVQVEDIKTLLFGIESQSLKEKLNDYHNYISKDAPKNKTKVHFLKFRKIAIAASIIIAAGCFWIMNQNSNTQLYADYFTPDPGLPTVMSNNSNFEFYDAMVDYKQGDYKVAIEKWQLINRKNDTLNYFIGVALLADKKHQDAISFLEQSVSNPQFPLLNDAHYYLGLAYLKNGEIELAKIQLSQSSVDQSKSLLSELEKD